MDSATLIPFIPLDMNARRAWIFYMLRLRGYTVGSLAKSHGLHPRNYTAALWKPYPKGERAIAAAIGVEPQAIWPERYGPDGKPNRRRGRKPGSTPSNNKASKHASQCQRASGE